MNKSANLRMRTFIGALLIISFFSHNIYAQLSSLAKNDAFPVFTSLDPHTYLQTREKLIYKCECWAEDKRDCFSITASGFGQNADRGKTIKGENTLNEDMETNTIIELGDLTGRSGIIALLYGCLPEGKVLPPTLENARMQLFPNVPLTEPLKDPKAIDPSQKFGFFSFPLQYRKRGARFELSARVTNDIGVSIETGVSCIRQVVKEKNNLTDESDKDFTICPGLDQLTKENVNCLLMEELPQIANEIGLDICDFVETSIEEIRFNLFWRHLYECYPYYDEKWPDVLIIPFAEISASLSPGKKKDPNKQFALPFGNNDHNAIGVSGGMNFDFVETIEIGVEAGFTYFFDRTFSDFRVPNSDLQTTIFPFTTDVTIEPGHNWHFGAKMAAHHFLDNLSVYFQWLIVEHKEDKIKLKKQDKAFITRALEKTTSFKTKLANIGFNYDICPNMTLGLLWQTPFSQRNTYRSTTILFSINGTF